MNLSGDYEAATLEVFTRAEALIDTRIWEGIDKQRLYTWLEHFQGKEEKYLAAILLNGLIYRSDRQTTALALQLFQRRIPRLLESTLPSLEPAGALISALQQETDDPGIRIVPIINATDPPTKSGPMVCRFLRRTLHFSDRWMIWPEQINEPDFNATRVFIFVDDFLGSGRQAIRFFTTLQRASIVNRTLIYSPFVAYMKGVEALNRRHPPILVTSAETFDFRHKLFHRAAATSTSLHSPAHAKSLYTAFLQRRNLAGKLGRFEYGFEKMAMAVSFQHGTPNASLPIFWLRRDPLRPLFDR
jgi:hypothetical protein